MSNFILTKLAFRMKLVECTDTTESSIKNKGKVPTINTFVKLIVQMKITKIKLTNFDILVRCQTDLLRIGKLKLLLLHLTATVYSSLLKMNYLLRLCKCNGKFTFKGPPWCRPLICFHHDILNFVGWPGGAEYGGRGGGRLRHSRGRTQRRGRTRRRRVQGVGETEGIAFPIHCNKNIMD